MKISCWMTSVVNPFKILLLACSLLLAGCLRNEAQNLEIKEIKGEIFGAYYIIKYRGDLPLSEFEPKLILFFQDFNNEFSTYQEDSIISEFNRLPKNKKLSVSPRFIEMLKLVSKFHQDTNGAFDPTLGPVIKAWGFGGGKKKTTPSDSELKAAMAKVGFSAVKWDESSLQVWKEKEGLELDVNAFAPGWAGDLIGKILEHRKITDYMIDMSGELVFKGTKDGKNLWVGAIEKPSLEGRQVQIAFRMNNESISTSGNYRNFFDESGERKSHIIDPRTGKPVTHQISSASVIAPTGAESDTWSTAFMVLGPEGLDIAKKHDIKVLLLEAKKPNLFDEIYSPAMLRFLEAQGL